MKAVLYLFSDPGNDGSQNGSLFEDDAGIPVILVKGYLAAMVKTYVRHAHCLESFFLVSFQNERHDPPKIIVSLVDGNILNIEGTFFKGLRRAQKILLDFVKTLNLPETVTKISLLSI
jgi:hypothetical protein